MQIQSIGIVGAGTMGNGIAQVFAGSGFNITLHDQTEELVQKGLNSISNSLDRFIKKETISENDKQKTLANIHATTVLHDLADTDLIIEAATENLDIKLSIFKTLDSLCKPEALLASNTSSISITRLASETAHPENVIGMHFMNPVPLMQLVEIVRAKQTSDETCELIENLGKQIGKTPVVCNDSPGFVSNRILMPMINEAIYTLYEGVATAEAIDEIMVLGMAHPMGPLALADLIGLDTCLSVMEVLHKGLKDDKYLSCPLLRRMVDAGYLGRKNGQGFYDYDMTV